MFKKNEKGIKRKYIIIKLYIDLKKEENIIELIKRDIEYIEIEKKIEVIDLKINESEIRKKILKRIGIGIILRRRGIERIWLDEEERIRMEERLEMKKWKKLIEDELGKRGRIISSDEDERMERRKWEIKDKIMKKMRKFKKEKCVGEMD